MKKFSKNRWPELVFFCLMVVTVVFYFVPMFNVVLKDGDGNKSYLPFTILDFIKGITGHITFGGNLLLFISSLLLFLGFVVYYVSIFVGKKHNKIANILVYVSLSCIIINLFSILFLYAYVPYLNKGLGEVQNFKEVKMISYSYGIYLGAMVLIALIALRRVFSNIHFSIYEITEIAILCALSLVLDKIKIPLGATGGSINASCVPLVLIAIRHGPLKGLLASSVVFGFLSCLLDGYGLNTYPFDYLIAFSGYASTGLFTYLFNRFVVNKNKENKEGNEFAFLLVSIVLGSIISFVTRMVGHSLSSIIFYNYDIKAAIIYNIAYVSFSVFGSMVILLVLAKPIQIINHKYPVKTRNKKMVEIEN